MTTDDASASAGSEEAARGIFRARTGVTTRLRRIRRSELQDYARLAGFELDDDELDEFQTITEAISRVVDPFIAQSPPPPERRPARRDPGRRPTAGEDPLNAVIRWCSVSADVDGPLAGKRIGLKDNMALAGVPMSCASRVLDGYVPEEDCVLADRLLAAGAEMVAKLNMDAFAWSGGAETSDFGAILNPYDTTRTASGSSGGSGASLFYDGIDITFGTDQAGSIRLPAAWCGVLGLKPTHGLVPYTGISTIDPTYDHVGPLARTVDDLALALEVVAGKHDSDPRQQDVRTESYVKVVDAADDDLSGTTIGVLAEGFGWDGPDGTHETEQATRAVVAELEELGATTREVSVPEHRLGAGMMFVALCEGQTALTLSHGNGYHHRGRYAEDLPAALGKGMRALGREIPPSLKMVLLMGTHLREHYYSSLYAKAQNMAPWLRAAFDRVFEDVDFIVMPTATHYAYVHKPDATPSERVLRGDSMLGNTATFDATGHPALSMPAAEADGLPVGVMVVGPMWSDAAILALARTYERRFGWRPHSAPDLPTNRPTPGLP